MPFGIQSSVSTSFLNEVYWRIFPKIEALTWFWYWIWIFKRFKKFLNYSLYGLEGHTMGGFTAFGFLDESDDKVPKYTIG